MKIFICGSVLFILGLFIQICFWKIRVPIKQIKSLLLIFSALLLIGIIILILRETLVTLAEIFQLVLFYFSLALAYLTTYSAVEADSPTLIIVAKIDQAKKSGLAKGELSQVMTDDFLIKLRINDLMPVSYTHLTLPTKRLV